mmetsp:Transcript_29578/g.39339  ORF Transcript_29578/g.39339 Transcript_29578/m.39339 type:complete len:93 (-) Transcript_29578:1096-1374(-)
MIDIKLLLILVTLLFSNSSYAIIAPFLPLELEEHGIDGATVGLIFGVYSVGRIITSLVVGKISHRLGVKKILSFGIFTMGSCFCLHSFVPLF